MRRWKRQLWFKAASLTFTIAIIVGPICGLIWFPKIDQIGWFILALLLGIVRLKRAILDREY